MRFRLLNSKFLQILNSKFFLLFLSHKKKSATGELRLIGMPAVASTLLDPEGAVLVSEELWIARSFDGRSIPAGSTVKVVGSIDHLLLVQPRTPIRYANGVR